MYEEDLADLETQFKRLEEEFGTFLTTIVLAPKDRFDIIQAAAQMALQNLQAARAERAGGIKFEPDLNLEWAAEASILFEPDPPIPGQMTVEECIADAEADNDEEAA